MLKDKKNCKYMEYSWDMYVSNKNGKVNGRWINQYPSLKSAQFLFVNREK